MKLIVVLGLLAAIVAGGLWLMRRLRQAGRDAQRADTAEEGLARAEKRRRIDEDVARLSDPALDERLSKHYRD